VKHLDADPETVGKALGADRTIMYSWKSTVLAACAPPLRMFIIGTGSTLVTGPEIAVQRESASWTQPAPQPSTPTEWRWRRGDSCWECRRGRASRNPPRSAPRRTCLEPRADDLVHVLHRLEHALAAEPLLITVAQLDRFVLAVRRRSARRPVGAPLDKVTSLDGRLPRL